ncbi:MULTISPECIES: hypothetical protein [Klebsiella pneumoniae complex]|uniref:hypothetical protein n=1 Tax=Klebsiella pneumoniae complex TaxID=3390273 RepID=UPI000BAE47D4|nr:MULTISPECIES: hypothetical protein [Klebsiella]MCS4374539.1 hypothetical protein [Klebsiella quasipneumoniae subsp. similipneumoniae]MCS4418713.1 hypothetical protein [Klebsiella quasipneumoniae subsp. similipneumoniae]PAX29670.1 hypothetical protein CLI88_26855 [Klebsiella pneumoniae]RYI34245.1 hypothetical protein EVY37_29625 [Klebsiella pneumoniae]HCB0270725.1 hypothetical protein [Klebsiella pneumoniae]
MPEQKMQITSEPFDDYTGSMFRTSFTNSISDSPMSERAQGALKACFEADVFTPPAPPKDKEPAEKDDSSVGI